VPPNPAALAREIAGLLCSGKSDPLGRFEHIDSDDGYRCWRVHDRRLFPGLSGARLTSTRKAFYSVFEGLLKERGITKQRKGLYCQTG